MNAVKMKVPLLAGMMTLAILVSSCGNSMNGDDGTGPELTVRITPTATIAGGEVTLLVSLQRFTLEAPAGQPALAGHGHYHVYLDNASGLNDLTYSGSYQTQVPIPAGTSKGNHKLKIQLFNNDFSPVVPLVVAKANLTVQ